MYMYASGRWSPRNQKGSQMSFTQLTTEKLYAAGARGPKPSIASISVAVSTAKNIPTLTMSKDIVDLFKDADNRVSFHIGTGADDGKIMLSPDPKGTHKIGVYGEKNKNGRIVIGSLFEKFEQRIGSTRCEYHIVDGNVVVHLPKVFSSMRLKSLVEGIKKESKNRSQEAAQ